MVDYEVKTVVLFDTGFNDRECNSLMFEGMKDKITEDIRDIFESDETLASYITSNLTFGFCGYKARLEYTFSCHDENEEEAESFSDSSLRDIREELAERGYHIEQITCKAEEMSMEWLDRMEDMCFR